jgi:hypothetical protein
LKVLGPIIVNLWLVSNVLGTMIEQPTTKMKLKTVHITNFRCVEDSNEFSIGELTCNPARDEHKGFDSDRDYPRHRLSEFDEGDDVVTTTWELDQPDVAAVEEVLGQGALKSVHY